MEVELATVMNSLLAVLALFVSKALVSRVFDNTWIVQHRASTLKARLARQKEKRKQIRLNYTPTKCGSLDRFDLTKARSPCLFAKQALLWGSCEYERDKSISQNMLQVVPALSKFASLVEDSDQKLDGFLIEIRGLTYGDTVANFAATVRIALGALSKHDPSGLNTMKMKSINSSSWYFSFDMVPMFITTFAPCYSPSSARHLHLAEANADSCFILLQPEISFLRHGIGADHAETQWNKPETIRDKIRVNFRNKQQPYHIPTSLKYPVAASIVHSEDGKSYSVRFWDTDKYPDHDDHTTTSSKMFI